MQINTKVKNKDWNTYWNNLMGFEAQKETNLKEFIEKELNFKRIKESIESLTIISAKLNSNRR
jgi:hypothetical protein